jgi:hypothetical protein
MEKWRGDRQRGEREKEREQDYVAVELVSKETPFQRIEF